VDAIFNTILSNRLGISMASFLYKVGLEYICNTKFPVDFCSGNLVGCIRSLKVPQYRQNSTYIKTNGGIRDIFNWSHGLCLIPGDGYGSGAA